MQNIAVVNHDENCVDVAATPTDNDDDYDCDDDDQLDNHVCISCDYCDKDFDNRVYHRWK